MKKTVQIGVPITTVRWHHVEIEGDSAEEIKEKARQIATSRDLPEHPEGDDWYSELDDREDSLYPISGCPDSNWQVLANEEKWEWLDIKHDVSRQRAFFWIYTGKEVMIFDAVKMPMAPADMPEIKGVCIGEFTGEEDSCYTHKDYPSVGEVYNGIRILFVFKNPTDAK